jgi:hypothetical protein
MPEYKQLFIGGVWNKEGYQSVQLDLEKAGVGKGKLNFIIVKNEKKEKDTHPDFNLKMKNPKYKAEDTF